MKIPVKKTTQNITSLEVIKQYREKKSPKSTTGIKKEELELYRLEKDDVLLVKSIWQYLESQVIEVSLTCTWDWVSTWIEHYGDVVDYCFIIGTHKGVPCGITVVTRETNRNLPIPVKSLHIGTNGEPYQDQVQMISNQVLAVDKIRAVFYEALIDVITIHFPWDEIVFDDYKNTDATLVNNCIRQKGYRVSMDAKVCKYFDFSKLHELDSVIDTLGQDTRYWIKRSKKILGDDFMLEWADTEEHALDIFHELAYLFQKKWTRHGQRGIFASKRYVSFHQSLISKLITSNKVILFRVTSRQYGTVGCVYLFVSNNIAYGYQIGLQDYHDMDFGSVNPNRIKAGFILHTFCMQECLNRGFKAYNFSTGDYLYKNELTNAEEIVSTVSLQRTIVPYIREEVLKFHLKLMHNRNASYILRPLKMLFG